MNKEQFYHYNCRYSPSYTMAVDVDFTSEDLNGLASSKDKSIYLQVGIANLHPNDIYSKKIGREVSMGNKKEQVLKLRTVNFLKEHTYFYLENDEIVLQFRISDKSPKPHFIYGSFQIKPIEGKTKY